VPEIALMTTAGQAAAPGREDLDRLMAAFPD